MNLPSLIDDAKCYALVRQLRWPDGVRCPDCGTDTVIKHGRDDTQQQRQRYHCHGCRIRFDDLTGTIFAGHHQPLRVWVLCLYLMGLNLSNEQIAQELDLDETDAQAMTEQLRHGLAAKLPTSRLRARSRSTRSTSWPGTRATPRPSQKRAARPTSAAEGAPGRGTLAKEKPPIFGMIQRGGEVVIRMLANVQQVTIRPVIEGSDRPGGAGLHRRVRHLRPPGGWGYAHQTVCHARGEYARDDDGTASARCTSTPWRGSGRCCARGSAPTGGSRRRSCRSTSPSSSSCTTPAGKALLVTLLGLLVT